MPPFLPVHRVGRRSYLRLRWFPRRTSGPFGFVCHLNRLHRRLDQFILFYTSTTQSKDTIGSHRRLTRYVTNNCLRHRFLFLFPSGTSWLSDGLLLGGRKEGAKNLIARPCLLFLFLLCSLLLWNPRLLFSDYINGLGKQFRVLLFQFSYILRCSTNVLSGVSVGSVEPLRTALYCCSRMRNCMSAISW